MKPPAFWLRDPAHPGWQARLLAPLAALYARGTARRLAGADRGYRARVPVICVGNLNAGGTGKTPTVMALTRMLGDRGRAVHIVTRGYGGRMRGPVRIEARHHGAAEAGDEALLLSAFAPVWLARDRAAGVRAAVAAGAEAVLLDDGFQNPSVVKDLSLVVVKADTGFGNGRVIPAGPLREPVESGLARADMVLSIGSDEAQDRFRALWGERIAVPRLTGRLAPLATGMDWTGLRALAFAGIGQPEGFFRTLAEAGAEVLATHALEDHQPLTTALMARLERRAVQLSAQLVTTEKDAVRLPARYRPNVLTLPVRLTLDDPAPLARAFERLGL